MRYGKIDQDLQLAKFSFMKNGQARELSRK